MRNVGVFLVPFCAFVAGVDADEFSHFTVTKQRKADEVTVSKERGVTVFNVRSSNGIGWAKIENEKAWPMKAIVRLRYGSGRQWQHLENFTISSRRATISANLRGNLDVRPANEKGREALASLEKQELNERVGVSIVRFAEGLQIELPMSWLAEESEFTLRWIDAYRN